MVLKKPSNRMKGIILCFTLIVCSMTVGLWAHKPVSTHVSQASSCETVFAGRAGSFNTCNRIPDDQVSRNIQRGVGTTFTGCVIGLLSGGPVGAGWGCVGGLASNIPWGGWGD
jgi:hypothetical protein